jgi:glycine/serine hydroxymethyltransferase
MSLAEGGHLTHGASVNASGKLYNFHQYGLDANEVLDYDKVEHLAKTQKPKMILQQRHQCHHQDVIQSRSKKIRATTAKGDGGCRTVKGE